MREVPRGTPGRPERAAGEVPGLSWVWLVVAVAVGAVAAGAAGVAVIWIAGVGGWFRFTVALLIVGICAPIIHRSQP
jgi:hypothetical protein